MNLPAYQITERASDFSDFRFNSEGPNGVVHKVIIFDRLEKGYFNLKGNICNIALLDVLDNGTLSDTTLSNNGDIVKILATTVQVLVGYTTVFPDRSIFIKGSDEAGKRTSLYHRAIKNNFSLFEQDFYIDGVINNYVKEHFNPNKEYIAFLVKRK